ncbi:hypothetical protein [Clostridium sp.]|uniref:hypothetical protein n=1 Tax=Clostridium sp. TaxID=1506 RepID=UPI003F3A81AA
MSKRRHKHRVDDGNGNNFKNNNQNNNPFGINPAQLMSLLGGNMDMSQIGNLLSSMNTDGFDLNNLNLGALQNIMGNNGNQNNGGVNLGNFDMGPLQSMFSGAGGSGGIDFSALQNIMGGADLSKLNNNSSEKSASSSKGKSKNKDLDYEDENLEFLMAIRRIVDTDKIDFIDRIIEAYNDGSFK